ncbi:hypothetical protein MEC_00307 [Bartonella alsatica IBS 382]|uniref:Uncharacterized protein n=2 Tax=Bartonella alsatica TaxID=52764 RepID=J1IVV7_9HYPH|nr:hypothetical protein MEC_00307 [Bartonella alsatica IBS 382]
MRGFLLSCLQKETHMKTTEKPAKRTPPKAGQGRVKGVPNKTTRILKEAVLKAAERAGKKMETVPPMIMNEVLAKLSTFLT